MLKEMMQKALSLKNEKNQKEDSLWKFSSAASVETTQNMKDLTKGILDSKVALLIEGASTAIPMAAPGGESRSIAEPDSEPAVRGPRDGFVENISTNLMLLRRRLRTNRLKVETLEVGDLTRTQVAVCYIQGAANDKVVEEAKTRLQKITPALPYPP